MNRIRVYQHLPGIKYGVDLVVWALAFPLAVMIYRGEGAPGYPLTVVSVMLGLGLLKGVTLRAFELHHQSWSNTTFQDLVTLSRAVLLVSVVTLLVVWLTSLPLLVAPLEAGIALVALAGMRALARYDYERGVSLLESEKKRKIVLIIGAGAAGALVVREMMRHPELALSPVGFLDDDPHKFGRRVASVPVIGTTEDIGKVVRKYRVDEIFIAVPSANRETLRRLIDRVIASKTGVNYRLIPGVKELLSGKRIDQVQNVRIEDLLRRPPVRLDSSAIAGYIMGQTVMVTGAGGSIGSELVRQICRFGPRELILFGRGENSIYGLERELDRDWPDVSYHSIIGATQNRIRLEHVFTQHQPQVVFHTAAHKHVPLMETNPEEAIFNNVIGSKNLIELALRHGVSHFVNISTDKAINPSSVMGATKRLIEFIVQSAARKAEADQVFVSVRFGNVLGSRGSVIPVFNQQIKAGGPITVTHPEMVRYFMTIPEATQLVLQAAGQGANGCVYILDMGEPVKIVELARDLVRLSGLEPDKDIKIVFTGTRPGEKLYEELMTSRERDHATTHEKIFTAKATPFYEDDLKKVIVQLVEAALRSDGQAIRRLLSTFIPEYTQPSAQPAASAESPGRGVEVGTST